MRYILHPEDRKVRGILPNGKVDSATVKFAPFISAMLGTDPKATEGGIRTLRMVGRVIDAIEATKPGEVIELQDADHELAARILEAPSVLGANAWVARQVLDWFDAVIKAPTKRPTARKA